MIKIAESIIFILVGLIKLNRDFPWLASSLIDILMVFVGAAIFISLWVYIPLLDGFTFFTLAAWIIGQWWENKKGDFYVEQ